MCNALFRAAQNQGNVYLEKQDSIGGVPHQGRKKSSAWQLPRELCPDVDSTSTSIPHGGTFTHPTQMNVSLPYVA